MSTIPEPEDLATVQAQGVPFVMIPNELIDADPSPQALAAYAHLRRFADWNTGEVEFRLQLLAERLGYSRRQSVLPYLDELRDLGFLEVREQHGANGQRLRNAYSVLTTPVRSSARPPFALPHGARALDRTTSTDPLRTDPLRTSGRPAKDPKPEQAALIPELEKPAEEILRVLAEERARATQRPVSKRKPSPRARAAAGRLAADVDAALLVTVLRWAYDPANGDPWWLQHLVNAEDLERQWDRLEARCSAAIREATKGAAAPKSDHQAMLDAIGWSEWDWETATPRERTGMRENALQNGWRPTQAQPPVPASA